MILNFRILHLIRRCRSTLNYVQGQNPEPNIREYFYYIDHQGMLFLDDARIKNFTSCYKEKDFLRFFFKRLKINNHKRYSEDFPYLSLCGKERNFVRCDDRPIVFTHLYDTDEGFRLCYGYQGGDLEQDFQPQHLWMHPRTMRLYHPALERVGGIGLLRSVLAQELAARFSWASEDAKDAGEAPISFRWNQQDWSLTNGLVKLVNSQPARLRGLCDRPDEE